MASARRHNAWVSMELLRDAEMKRRPNHHVSPILHQLIYIHLAMWRNGFQDVRSPTQTRFYGNFSADDLDWKSDTPSGLLSWIELLRKYIEAGGDCIESANSQSLGSEMFIRPVWRCPLRRNIIYVINELIYPGRVTDDSDRWMLRLILSHYFTQKFSKASRPSPDFGSSFSVLLATVDSSPVVTKSVVVGTREGCKLAAGPLFQVQTSSYWNRW
jgi:hypothetical protein